MTPRRGFLRRSRSRISCSRASGLFAILAIASGVFVASAIASQTSTPSEIENEVMRIAKNLKPIPNDEWKKIAGDHITQKYVISKDDTLWDVSKRLFGDPRYWPKIWALNNGRILNPHVIFPGNSINFMPGTGTTLPGVSVETAENGPLGETPTESTEHPARSQEWKMLPRQEWENVSLQLPPQVDPLGFDERSRIVKPPPVSYDLPLIASSDKIQPLGFIFADDKESDFITLDDIIFIHAKGDGVKVGQEYSVIDDPHKLQSDATPRVGWGYPIVGRVKILQERAGDFVAIVESAYHPFTRGTNIVPLQPRVNPMDPIPGPSPIRGVVFLDPRFSTSTISQHDFVFIDRGSNDGVTPGMMFRAYQHRDPSNGKHITKANVLISADIMVVQTSPKFSTGLVKSSDTYFTEGTQVTLLTNVSDLLGKPNPSRTRIETLNQTMSDDLDSLDNGEGLSDIEKRELRQLEKWKENPAPAPSAAPTEEIPPPEAEVPPPPAPEAQVPPPPPPEAPTTSEVPPTAPAPELTPTPTPTSTSQSMEAIPPPPSDTEIPPPPPSDEEAPPAQASSTAPSTSSNAAPAAPPAAAPAAPPADSGEEALPPPPADQPVTPPSSSSSSGTPSTNAADSDIPPPPPPGP